MQRAGGFSGAWLLVLVGLTGVAAQHSPGEVSRILEDCAELLRHNLPNVAELKLQRALEVYPQDARLWLRLGTARLAAGDQKGGIAAFERAGELTGPSAERARQWLKARQAETEQRAEAARLGVEPESIWWLYGNLPGHYGLRWLVLSLLWGALAPALAGCGLDVWRGSAQVRSRTAQRAGLGWFCAGSVLTMVLPWAWGETTHWFAIRGLRLAGVPLDTPFSMGAVLGVFVSLGGLVLLIWLVARAVRTPAARQAADDGNGLCCLFGCAIFFVLPLLAAPVSCAAENNLFEIPFALALLWLVAFVALLFQLLFRRTVPLYDTRDMMLSSAWRIGLSLVAGVGLVFLLDVPWVTQGVEQWFGWLMGHFQ